MKKIVFVYNANSGYLNSIIDGLHKSIRPSTYQCQLCALTYSSVLMKKQWKDFLDSLPYDVEIVYKDEFEKKYKDQQIGYPSVLLFEGENGREIISSSRFEKLSTLEDLISAVQKSIK